MRGHDDKGEHGQEPERRQVTPLEGMKSTKASAATTKAIVSARVRLRDFTVSPARTSMTMLMTTMPKCTPHTDRTA